MSLSGGQFYSFGEFGLDTNEGVLRQEGKAVPLTPKMFEVLWVLVQNHGHVVTKDDLMNAVWADSFVEEGNLTTTIGLLRKALNDNAHDPIYIETVSRRGYRFIADVNIASPVDLANGSAQTDTDSLGNSSAAGRKISQILVPAAVVVSLMLLFVGIWWILRTGTDETPSALLLTSPLNAEKISNNGKVSHVVISADGKNVVYTNGLLSDRGSVWIRQLESSNNVQIIPPSDDVYSALELSPDGNFLYFARGRLGSPSQHDIYRVSIFGGIPNKIIGGVYGRISVSPNGETLSFVRCPHKSDEYCSLWVADAADGRNERRLVVRPSPLRIAGDRFSPDGRSVAFASGQSRRGGNDFGLMAVDLETGAERELTDQKFFDIHSLVWLPNQAGLLMTASRIPNKNFRIWRIASSSGVVEPLTNDSESYRELSLDSNGSRLVATEVKEDFHLRIYQTENPTNPRELADATRVSIAPNGKIVFSSTMTGNYDIWTASADGSDQRQLTNDPADDARPVVSSLGKVIFFGSNRTGELQVWRMNPDGSDQMQITKGNGGWPLGVSEGGEWVYYVHALTAALWRVRANGGDENLILDKRNELFALTPDGSRVAFPDRHGDKPVIAVYSISAETTQTFSLAEPNTVVVGLTWLADGKRIGYVSSNSVMKNNALWLQPLTGESPRRIAMLGDEFFNSLAFAPDGKSFAVVSGGWKHDGVFFSGLR